MVDSTVALALSIIALSGALWLVAGLLMRRASQAAVNALPQFAWEPPKVVWNPRLDADQIFGGIVFLAGVALLAAWDYPLAVALMGAGFVTWSISASTRKAWSAWTAAAAGIDDPPPTTAIRRSFTPIAAASAIAALGWFGALTGTGLLIAGLLG